MANPNKERFIKIWSSIRNSKDWPGNQKRPFTEFEAKLDMYLFLGRGTDKGTLKRGQFQSTLGSLSKRWRWSKSKIRRLLDRLETEKEISRKADRKMTVFTILGYEKWKVYPNSQWT